MRPRFKPNVSAKSSRKSNISKSVINSHSEDTTESSTKISLNEVDSNVPFIPPNSSKTAEDNVSGEQLNVEGKLLIFRKKMGCKKIAFYDFDRTLQNDGEIMLSFLSYCFCLMIYEIQQQRPNSSAVYIIMRENVQFFFRGSYMYKNDNLPKNLYVGSQQKIITFNLQFVYMSFSICGISLSINLYFFMSKAFLSLFFESFFFLSKFSYFTFYSLYSVIYF